MALEKELVTYKEKIEELKASMGKYVLIHGDSVAGIFDVYGKALEAGYVKFGLQPFLVKKIEKAEQAHFISRFVPPVRRAS